MGKNRLAKPLGFLKILIVDADGEHQYDPNSVLRAAFEGDLLYLKPIDTERSILSGEPAVVYMSHDLRVPLTIDELHRLISLNLKAKEYRKLVDTYDIAHEWHSDFYTDRGFPIQPKELPEDTFKIIKRDIKLNKLEE